MDTRSVFLFLLPRSRLAGPCFRSVGWFSSWLEWELPLVEVSGESLSPGRAFFGRLVLPDSRALGAGLPGPHGSWSLGLLPPSRSGCVQLSLPLLSYYFNGFQGAKPITLMGSRGKTSLARKVRLG